MKTHEAGLDNNAGAQVYQWLSSLFSRELAVTDIEQLLLEDHAHRFLSYLAQEHTLTHWVKELSDTTLSYHSEEGTLELTAQYCQLFLIDIRDCAAPYAGCYLNDDNLLYGRQHQLLQSLAQDWQLGLNDSFKEPYDHISVILVLAAVYLQKDTFQEEIFRTFF